MATTFETHHGSTVKAAITSLLSEVVKELHNQVPWIGFKVSGMNEEDVEKGMNLVHLYDPKAK